MTTMRVALSGSDLTPEAEGEHVTRAAPGAYGMPRIAMPQV